MDESEPQLLKQGAEARVYICKYLGKQTIIKERFQKKYRHPDLDIEIVKERIRNEARSILRCKYANIRTPALYLVDFERRKIYMEYLATNITVKDFVIKHGSANEHFDTIAKMIGQTLRKLHDYNIVHGDLTSSNMLIIPKVQNDGDWFDPAWLAKGQVELVMIDFGLSYIDASVEDKGVDLYVLERALLSTHSNYENLFETILEAYKTANPKGGVEETISKFEEVRARGRKRTMIG
ncbi:EKC/KEOPS complex subunit TP53RK [Trichoplusia ni]|uniref:non-specific serine/threonine protein kinase n=1 Tax=Trichoplusia ni TaxID=7111 RepID=A0A7E5VK74_TRINI|nr:EKC/KEOPS complex subunit TP53RK [Trichoplusia ni]